MQKSKNVAKKNRELPDYRSNKLSTVTHTKRSMLNYCISFWCGCQTLKGDFLMEDLIVKNVDVMGDSIKAAKDAAGNIWVGVRWVCDALDMTEGQMKRQVKNIKKDMVFGEGGSNLGIDIKCVTIYNKRVTN